MFLTSQNHRMDDASLRIGRAKLGIGRANPAISRANPAISRANPATSRANPATSRANPATSLANPVTSRADPKADGVCLLAFSLCASVRVLRQLPVGVQLRRKPPHLLTSCQKQARSLMERCCVHGGRFPHRSSSSDSLETKPVASEMKIRVVLLITRRAAPVRRSKRPSRNIKGKPQPGF